MKDETALKEFGSRVKQLRLYNGWTQKELAERCGYKSDCSNTTINKIEKGKSDIPLTSLLAFSKAFGVSVAYLIGDSSSEEEEQIIAQQRALSIMNRRLSEQEQNDLMEGMAVYFMKKMNEVNVQK